MRWMGVIFFLPIIAFAQDRIRDSRVETYITAFYSAEGIYEASPETLNAFVQKLESRKNSFKSEEAFLNFVFNKTHQVFLKNFKQYATFSDLFKKSGDYNCLTGTALYALILEELTIRYEMIETNYHIFLLASTSTGKILLEVTDPINGFVSNPLDIEKRINTYRENKVMQASSNKTYYRFKTSLYNSVDLNNLVGLMHYNLAVAAYNEQNLDASIFHLENALKRYTSPRIEEFARLVLITVNERYFEWHVKENYLQKLQALHIVKSPFVASLK